MNNKKLCLILASLTIISFSLSLYHIDFSIPPTSDDSYGYVLRTFSILNDDLSEPARKTIGWPIFLSIFYSFFDSTNFLDYVNTARLLSMIISSASVFPMYLLARKFFNQNISIVASCMFAFEPHLLYNSAHALSESIFIFLTILASVSSSGGRWIVTEWQIDDTLSTVSTVFKKVIIFNNKLFDLIPIAMKELSVIFQVT